MSDVIVVIIENGQSLVIFFLNIASDQPSPWTLHRIFAIIISTILKLSFGTVADVLWTILSPSVLLKPAVFLCWFSDKDKVSQLKK